MPASIRKQARDAYELFRRDPSHPGLQFKKVHERRPIYSARIGLHYRALGIVTGDVIVWYWVGSHAEYDRLVRQLPK